MYSRRGPRCVCCVLRDVVPLPVCSDQCCARSVLWRREVKSSLASPTDRPPCPLIVDMTDPTSHVPSAPRVSPPPTPRGYAYAYGIRTRATRVFYRESCLPVSVSESQTDRRAQNINILDIGRGALARPTAHTQHTTTEPRTHEHAHSTISAARTLHVHPHHHSDALLTELLLARVVELPPG